jgi:hypothetical protein
MPRRGATPKGLIIMNRRTRRLTRTYLITADGTRFVRQGTTRRIAGIATGIVFTTLTAIFLSAAIIGASKAAREGINPEPAASTAIALRTADKACARAPKGSKQDCLALYMRSAWTTPNTYTPAGAKLVKECFDQYRGIELRSCFNQEIG